MSVSETVDKYATTVNADDRHKAFYGDWENWHQQHLSRLADPWGFLAITGLHWLDEKAQRFAGVPGEWQAINGEVKVTLGAGEAFSWQGEEITGEFSFGELADNTSVYPQYGNTKLEVARRTGRYLLRPRNPDYKTVKHFTGVPAYYPDPAWRVEAQFIAYPQARTVTVGAVVAGLKHVYSAPGDIEFTLHGKTVRLTAFAAGENLQLLFTDETSGHTTSDKQRALTIAPPDAHGRVVLDFNRAINLMCAYTPAATCPLPPPENHIPLAIEAGEKRYS
ncbi:DUF1684 domain-containing protein [Erwinia sp. V71]|uniref:DUF1684 domain-containing protein n=1 Tax=Erwinia sp. V71 TaxID=3369424 RepID=UPI003F612A54